MAIFTWFIERVRIRPEMSMPLCVCVPLKSSFRKRATWPWATYRFSLVVIITSAEFEAHYKHTFKLEFFKPLVARLLKNYTLNSKKGRFSKNIQKMSKNLSRLPWTSKILRPEIALTREPIDNNLWFLVKNLIFSSLKNQISWGFVLSCLYCRCLELKNKPILIDFRF